MGEPTDVNEAAVEAGAVALATKYPDLFGGSYAMPREVASCVLAALASARRWEPCPTCSGAGCSSWVQGGVRYMSGDIPCPGCDNGTVEVPLLVALARENAATAEARQ